MGGLISRINELKKSEISSLIDKRVREFKELGRKTTKEIFKELSFCLLTANYDAEKAIKIQREIGDGFLSLSEKKLAEKLKELHYRYPNTRANYIAEARIHINTLKRILHSFQEESELREWLVRNIKGLGMKEASHFLRNIGFTNLAIIDFHILDILKKYGIANKPKVVTRKYYLEVEAKLKKIAKKVNLNLAELDLYLWYSETGKVLK